jgi:hypothetical protein
VERFLQVVLAHMNNDDVHRVLDKVQAWRKDYERGGPRVVGIKPKLEPDERYLARVATSGTFRRDRDDLNPSWLAPRVEGAAFATSTRVLVAGTFRRILHQWRWADLSGVTLLPQWLGVRLDSSPEASVIDVVAHARPPEGKGQQLTFQKMGWLKFEGAFAASKGGLDAWIGALPERLAGMDAP